MTHVSFLPLTGMWFAMMTAMMVPAVWPWVAAFNRLGGNTALFSGGYAAAWLFYSLAAAAIQLLLPLELSRGVTARARSSSHRSSALA